MTWTCKACGIEFCAMPRRGRASRFGSPRRQYCGDGCARGVDRRRRDERHRDVGVSWNLYARLVLAAEASGFTMTEIVERALAPALGAG
jgi:hypothetical protein